jgi:MFS family permease
LTNLNNNSKPFPFFIWVTVFCLSMVMIAAGAARGAFGVFFTPMEKELGWSAAQLSGTFSFSMIVEGIFSAAAGRLSDKYGTRIVLIFAGLISASGIMLMSRINSIWQIYLIYGIVVGIGLGGLFIPTVSLIAKQFFSNRSMITGIALSANGLGQLLAPLIAYQLIVVYNWRTSYIIQGILMCVLIIIPALFLKRQSPEIKQPVQPQDTAFDEPRKSETRSYSFNEARKTRLFWMMISMQACYAFCFLSVLVHIAPYIIRINIPASTAANILACIGGATIAGRLVLGALADRIGSRKTMLIGFGSLFISLTWLLLNKEVSGLFLFAIVCGFGVGGISASQSPLAADCFGLKSHGAIFGTIGGITVILGSFGPFTTGFLLDTTGNYTISFVVCVCISLTGLIICSLMKPTLKQTP